MRRDYYAVLGVAATAPPREIRQAYRRLARQYSPDVNFWETTARTLFEEIAEAYRILSDPDARSLYDRFGAQPDALAAGRRGEGVHCERPVSVWEALRGARIRVPTPQGEAVVVVPPATQAGQVFRLRGQGVPRPGDDVPGDLFVTVRVDVPGGLDARTDELVRELEPLMPLTARGARQR